MRRSHAVVGLVIGGLMASLVFSVMWALRKSSAAQSAQTQLAQAQSAQRRPTSGKSPAEPELFTDFESGRLQGWSKSAGATVSPASAAHGTFGVEIRANRAPGYLQWGPDVVEQGKVHVSLRAYVQLVSQADGESVDLITIKNSNLRSNFDFFVTSNTQQFKWDLNSANSAESAFTVKLGRWYLVEIQCDFAGTSYSAAVKIDGVNQGMITSPGELPATVRAVWLGTDLPKTHVQRYDDVFLRLGDSWPGFLGPVTG